MIVRHVIVVGLIVVALIVPATWARILPRRADKLTGTPSVPTLSTHGERAPS